VNSIAAVGASLKALLRRTAPDAYDAMVVWRNGSAVKALAGAPTRFRARRIVRSHRPFRIDICARMGLGATLMNLLILHHRFDREPGLKKIVASNPLFTTEGSRPDAIDSFFERHDAALDEECETIPFGHPFDISTHSLTEGLTIQRAHDLFNKHYAVRPRFMDEARTFLDSGASEVLGVHFRGSDKRMEAPRIAWDRIAATVDSSLDRRGTDSIFVATDELSFLRFMEQRYGGAKVRALDCRYLSDGPVPAHFQPGDGFEKGREALVTMLILSMCKLCVRVPSNLSAFSKILNPALPMVTLGEPYPPIPFPENEILSQAAAPASQ
jgi:hypothetical protein